MDQREIFGRGREGGGRREGGRERELKFIIQGKMNGRDTLKDLFEFVLNPKVRSSRRCSIEFHIATYPEH